MSPWGDRAIGEHCNCPSYVSRDGFPIEFSISWRQGVPEIRILFESLGDEPTPAACQQAGRDLTRALVAKPGVSIDRYDLVEDLFVTDDPRPYRPTVWHSLAWRPGSFPHYKVYFNPQVRGVANTGDVVAEAMGRLGLAEAWEPVGEEYEQLSSRGHVIDFFALDLRKDDNARVKVYFRHPDVDLSELDRIASLARHHDSARAHQTYRAVYGDAVTTANEPMTCLAFRRGVPEPEQANVYLRLPGNAETDGDAARRVADVMRSEGLDPESYLDTVSALAPLPVDETAGMHELLSFRTRADGAADLGVYFRFSVYDRALEGHV
ncbi:tryptophan dimethylallyltransferase family protein [Lentzea tibetensis]|nr:tryptophan dimethylallyltransferase family protein [Lentzea tibetensis]